MLDKIVNHHDTYRFGKVGGCVHVTYKRATFLRRTSSLHYIDNGKVRGTILVSLFLH